jgi:hypothetical protein
MRKPNLKIMALATLAIAFMPVIQLTQGPTAGTKAL